MLRHLIATMTLSLLLGGAALAQDEPLLGGQPPAQPEPPPTQPPPPPPPPPPPATPPPAAQPAPAQPAAAAATPGGMTPRKLKDITDTDHDMVVKDLGLQVVFNAELASGNLYSQQGGSTVCVPDRTTGGIACGPAPGSANDVAFSMLGMRMWLTRRVGLDAGVGLVVAKPLGADVDTIAGFGVAAGVPFALGVYRHVTMFAGPEVAFALFHVGSGVNPWMFNLRGKAGIELHLGFIDIPRVSLVGAFSLGLRVYNDNSTTEVVLGPDRGFTMRGLFETGVGLVFYL